MPGDVTVSVAAATTVALTSPLQVCMWKAGGPSQAEVVPSHWEQFQCSNKDKHDLFATMGSSALPFAPLLSPRKTCGFTRSQNNLQWGFPQVAVGSHFALNCRFTPEKWQDKGKTAWTCAF